MKRFTVTGCQDCESATTCDFVAESFRCATCKRDVPLCMGAADATDRDEAICDECWWEAKRLGMVCQGCAQRFTAEDLKLHHRISDNARRYGRSFKAKLCLWRGVSGLESWGGDDGKAMLRDV